MKSLAEIASMSAQDTTPGHLLSTNALAFFMLSNASTAKPLLSCASFSTSTLLPGFEDTNMDASQPYIKITKRQKLCIYVCK